MPGNRIILLFFILFGSLELNAQEVQSDTSLLIQLQNAKAMMDIGENYVQSFKIASQFLNNYKIQHDTRSISLAWNILGEIYRKIHNYKEALECYRKSAAITGPQSPTLNPSPIINIGTIYKNIGKYDSSFYYYDLVLNANDTSKHSMYAYILNRKAQVYLLQNDHSSAQKHANESLALYEKYKNEEGIILVLSTITQLNFKKNDLKACIQTGERLIQVAQDIEYYPEEMLEACKTIVQAFEKTNNPAKALHYQKLYDSIYTKLFGPSVNLQMLDEQLGLELQNQELERSLLIKNQRLAEGNIKNQKQLLLIIAAALVLAVVTIFRLVSKNKTIKNLNIQLNERQHEILTQSEELIASNEEIEAINSNLESIVKERSEKVIEQNERLTEYAYFNAHKIRGPLARILGLIGVMELDLKKEVIPYSEMLKQAGKDLDDSIKEINSILETDKGKSNNND